MSTAEKAARAGSPARIVPGCSRWAGYSQPTGTMLGGKAVCIPAMTGKSCEPRPRQRDMMDPGDKHRIRACTGSEAKASGGPLQARRSCTTWPGAADSS